MLVTLVLLVFGVLLFDMRKRLKVAEMRLAMLEGVQSPPSVDRHSREGGNLSPERSAWGDLREMGPRLRGDDEGEEAVPQTARVVVRTVETVEAPPPPPVEPVEQPTPPPAEPTRPSFGFEDLFGRRLPIWAGGVTLAVAGVLLVKYSIDAGLLSPLVRVVLGLLFGAALIGGAEVALRQEERVRDVRVRQALAGAGLATLYFSILAAHGLYGLVGPMTAFVGLAGVTALAMGLSLRFGAPSALLGLVGGLAAPALVEAGQPNVPLLTCYLALAVGGLTALSRTQRWMWLGVSALIGGAGWGVVLLAMGALDWASSLSVGLLVLMLGVVLPFFALSGAWAPVLRVGAAVVAAAQMAALVATGGFALLHWGLFGLLSVALVWLGREASLRPLSAVGLGVALLLAGAWPEPEMGRFVLVLAGFGVMYGGAALWRLWRAAGGLIETGQIAGLALGGFAVAFLHFYRSGLDQAFAGLALGAAVLPAAALALGWRKPREDGRFVMLATAVGLLLVVAGALGLAGWALAAVIAAVAAGLLVLAEKAADQRVEWSGWAFAFAALVAVAGSDDVVRLWGEAAAGIPLRWIAVAAMAGLFAWRARFAEGRVVAQGAAVLLGYGTMAQLLPAVWVPVGAALGLALVAESARWLDAGRLDAGRMLVGLGVAASIVGLWALWPLAVWLSHALLSLTGEPLLVRDLPALGESLRRLAVPAGLLGVALWRAGAVVGPWGRRVGWGLAAVLGGVAVHVAYKQVFGLGNVGDVTRLAFAERTVWEGLLMGFGFGVWRAVGHALPRPSKRVTCLSSTRAGGELMLVGAGLGHLLFYSVLLHNPLWFPQAVGGWPVVNLLLPAFALAFGALWLIERMRPEWAWMQRPADILRMVLIVLFALTTLRQMFVGSVLTVPGLGQAEDILRSVLALGLAIGFLLWGIHRQARDWRIASLLLMLAAVAKVFLLDASGLSGLLRIGSFLALGFSLIGIGWLYNRVLREPVNNSATNAA
ncbi:DUF2339 domain-containing protein [Sphingobium sp. EM0848]|uniref:DUF2339 domain-containing protein n=1 Tax=Sphingobium sp. EM0848 TaxID=2743473 RepID=UPI00159C78A9|nr:DUF2339 domain-containing protein [Sphingobium sp. EM0848]